MKTNQRKDRTLQLPGNILPSEGVLQELLPCLCYCNRRGSGHTSRTSKRALASTGRLCLDTILKK